MTNRMILAVTGLAAFVTYCFNRGQAAQVHKAQVKHDLHRWEDEGGNVPHIATPSPAPVPMSSFPGNGSAPRH